jgi:hypothetical protein
MYKLLEKVFELNKLYLFNSVSKNKKSLLKINLKIIQVILLKLFLKVLVKLELIKYN